jgi:hypothetical protein
MLRLQLIDVEGYVERCFQATIAGNIGLVNGGCFFSPTGVFSSHELFRFVNCQAFLETEHY